VFTAARSILRSEPRFDVSELFPPIEKEFEGYTELFRGRVLNAGAGHRDLSALVDGELVNQDIETGLHNVNIDVYSPLDDIPFPDGHFDAVICNAVLEHVADPEAVLTEFRRVLRPGGVLYLCVPFMQPEHLDPTDFQRYTSDGLARLVNQQGFAVNEVSGVHNVFTTLGWIVFEWLREVPAWRGRAARWVVLPWLRRKARHSTHYVHSVASAYRVICERRP
jgi:SAM-dependent methyltransferase